MSKQNFVLDFIANHKNFVLDTDDNNVVDFKRELLPRDISIFHIEEITFEEKAPRKEAFENVLSSLKIQGVQFLYLLLGNAIGVDFYFGVVRDLLDSSNLKLSIAEVGSDILSSGIQGNFRGSKIREIDPDNKQKLLNKIKQMNSYSIIDGVPGINEDNEDIQGVERVADIMMGDEYGIAIIAKPISNDDISLIENKLYEAYDKIIPFIKKNIQENKSDTQATGKSETSNSSITKGSSDSESNSTQSGSNQSTSTSKGKNFSESSGDEYDSKSSGKNESNQKTSGSSKSSSVNKGHTDNFSESNGSSVTINNNSSITKGDSCSIEFVDKNAHEWIKYLDEVIIPRLDYGKGKGIFITSTMIFTQDKANLMKLSNTLLSLYSGKSGNKVVLKNKIIDKKSKLIDYISNLQIPAIKIEKHYNEELLSRVLLSQFIEKDFCYYGNWLSTKELSLLAGLPQKEIIGLTLREEVDFGLNFKNDSCSQENEIILGKLVQSGRIIDKIDVSMDKRNLDKHIFIAGVTGSGKTTTCHKLLLDSKLPFLVIEPAKTEYRILADKNYFPDLLVFTLGNNCKTPFKLNPFEFFPHESISSRVDMIKASMEAAFDMEAAIPQILEKSIYECYKDYGWNVSNNKNTKYSDPFADGVYSFPTLGDLVDKIESVIDDQGFDARLKNDYIGSIRARLQGLIVGAKGLMLNCKRSLNLMDLLERKVVLELDEIRSGSEKSLIMGFILTNLAEALKGTYKKSNLRHLTLIEEAHRLLSSYQNGDSLNKKHGVEIFTDMLAEIRKYGEGLIIVDQIPNKLTPEILKNTNTKIIHKIFAQDDKEAIGNSIILSKEQQNFLSNLETGRAVIFTQGWNKPVQVQIEKTTDTSSEIIVDDNNIKQNILEFYQKSYLKGYLTGLEKYNSNPSTSEIQDYIAFLNDCDIADDYYMSIMIDFKINDNLKRKMKLLLKNYSKDYILYYIQSMFYNKDNYNQKLRERKIISIIESIESDCDYRLVDMENLLTIQK